MEKNREPVPNPLPPQSSEHPQATPPAIQLGAETVSTTSLEERFTNWGTD
jgi:hypothetical protein